MADGWTVWVIRSFHNAANSVILLAALARGGGLTSVHALRSVCNMSGVDGCAGQRFSSAPLGRRGQHFASRRSRTYGVAQQRDGGVLANPSASPDSSIGILSIERRVRHGWRRWTSRTWFVFSEENVTWARQRRWLPFWAQRRHGVWLAVACRHNAIRADAYR